MKLKKIIPGIILLIISLCCADAAYPIKNDKLKFERLPLDEGAALNLSYCMIQDHKGFLWFGTMYGLVKYDGKSFRIYKNNPDDSNSISFDDIISLYEDSKNNIWIGTWGGGLNKYDPSTGKITRFISETGVRDGIPDNIIWSICEDHDGYLWFGTETGGLSRYDPVKNVFKQYIHSDNKPESISSNSVHYLYKDSRGTLWICNGTVLSKYIRSRDSFINYKINAENSKISPRINSVIEDKYGTLLSGTAKGLYRFDINSGSFERSNIPEVNDKYIHTLCKGNDNTIWTGSVNGLFNINLQNDEVKEFQNEPDNPFSITGNNILNLLTDRSGILWINSYGQGITKMKNFESIFSSYANEPGNNNTISNNTVTSFCLDRNNNTWIGTSNGLNMFDKTTGKFETYSNSVPAINRISTITANGNLLWIGTVQGISLFDTKTKTYKNLPSPIAGNKFIRHSRIPSILKANTGKLFIGTYGNGLFVYTPGSNSLQRYSSSQFHSDNIRSDYILTLYQDTIYPGIIWIGSYGGVIRMDTKNNTFDIYRHLLNDQKSLSNDYVFSITRDSNKNLWIGTANGLNKFDESTKSFTHYFEKDGLPSSVISAIIEDRNGNLWLSTNYGISQYNIAENKFKNYSKRDGLLNNLFLAQSCLKDEKGDIYFGGTNGFDIIKASTIVKNNYLPGVYITSVEKRNNRGDRKEILPDRQIKLTYDENFLDINFISLDYNNPLRNLYIYKLEGVDNNWISSGNNNEARYTDLAPGDYTFRVKGSNSDGVFNPEEATLTIIIAPPFWSTTWFYALLVLLSIGSIYLFYRRKVSQKINRALALEKIREEESEKIRSKTAADFHDELGHRLTRISLLSEIIKRKIGDTSAEVTELLNKISANSMELYEGTKDFIWAIDPQKDSLYELLIRLKDFGDELFEDSDILFEVNGLDESFKTKSLTTDWKRHLALIFKEGMNNSLKHGMSSKIIIDSTVEADNIELTLSDNGRGFMPDMIDKGNGLKNMRKRAEKLYADLEVKSSPGNGTQIFFKGKIPGKPMHYN